MTPEILWLGALVIYFVFYAWYKGFQKPMTQAEVEKYIAITRENDMNPKDIETIREFGLRDDGKEFVMMNNIKLAPKPKNPNEPNPVEIMANYAKPFMKLILRSAAHPVFTGGSLSKSIETWGIDEESVEKWSVAGLVRYRSRRDIFKILTSEEFISAHGFKKQALIKSFAYPVAHNTGFLSVHIWVALVISNIAAFSHIALF